MRKFYRFFCVLGLVLAALSLSALPVSAQVHVRAPGVRVNVGGGFGGHGGFNRGFGFGAHGFHNFNSFGFGFNRDFGFNQFAYAAPSYNFGASFAPSFGYGCYGSVQQAPVYAAPSCSASVYQQAPVVVQAPPVVYQAPPVVYQQPVFAAPQCDTCAAAAAIVPSCGIGHFGALNAFAFSSFRQHGIGRGIGHHGRTVVRSRTVVRGH